MAFYSSDLLAALAQVGEHGVDAVLVDGAQCSRGNAQLHPAVLAGDPEPALVQVRLEAAAGFVHRVRDVVASRRTLAGDLADSGHCTPRSVHGAPLGQGGGGPGGRGPGGPAPATQCGSGSLHGGGGIAFPAAPAPATRMVRAQRAGNYARPGACGQVRPWPRISPQPAPAPGPPPAPAAAPPSGPARPGPGGYG